MRQISYKIIEPIKTKFIGGLGRGQVSMKQQGEQRLKTEGKIKGRIAMVVGEEMSHVANTCILKASRTNQNQVQKGLGGSR